MEEMSRTFRQAESAGYYDLDQAIRLYDLEIQQNDPKNFSAWNNRGVAKIKKAEEIKNTGLFHDGVKDINQAIELANAEDSKGFPLAEGNLLWAENVKKVMGF